MKRILDAAERRALPSDDFALPGKGEGPEGKQAGSYPIPDESHARSALSLVSQHGTPEEKKKVRAAVARKFPGINQEDEEFQYSPMLDSYQSDTSGYLTEQVAKDKRNKIKSEVLKINLLKRDISQARSGSYKSLDEGAFNRTLYTYSLYKAYPTSPVEHTGWDLYIQHQ